MRELSEKLLLLVEAAEPRLREISEAESISWLPSGWECRGGGTRVGAELGSSGSQFEVRADGPTERNSTPLLARSQNLMTGQ